MKTKGKFCFALLIVAALLANIVCSAATSADLRKHLDDRYMILVNRTHKVSSDYVPQGLVNYPGSSYQLEKECAAALQQMIAACKNAGNKTLYLYSGYRTYQRQYNKYYGKITYYRNQGYSLEKATKLTDEYYAPPGGSEHHTGLAADICTSDIVSKYGQLHESFGETKEGKWLRNNCHTFGFILRYDKGKEQITGYNYEPWHFRFVGKTAAQRIHQKKITFEEYISQMEAVYTKIKKAPAVTVDGGNVRFVSAAPVYYTTDLKMPTSASKKYTFALNAKDTTYTAAAIAEGYSSPAVSVTITKYGDIFKDIKKTDWFYTTVSEAVHKKLFDGTGDHLFAPRDEMTRAMFVQVFANLSGVDLSKYNGKTKYKDVSSKKWYARAIQWATQKGIVSGTGDDMFRPQSPITREQACVIIAGYFTASGKSVTAVPCSFSDRDKISAWALDAVGYCASKKIVSGKGKNLFDPLKSTTRAEAAQMVLSIAK